MCTTCLTVNSALPVCIYVYHMLDWCPRRAEENMSPLDLELRIVVSCRVGPRMQTQALCKNCGLSLQPKPQVLT